MENIGAQRLARMVHARAIKTVIEKMRQYSDWATSDKVSEAERNLLARLYVEDETDG